MYLFNSDAGKQLKKHHVCCKQLPLFIIYCDILKLVSAIFYQIFIFSLNDSTSKTVKTVLLFHRKSSFSSQDIQIFCNFFPSIPHVPGSKGQMEVK